MKRRNLIIMICSISLAFLLAISFTAYAWYVNVKTIGDMGFSILQIDSQVALYEAKDLNFNGLPDECDTTNKNKYYNPESHGYVPYINLYHQEKYDFSYMDQRYSLVSDSSSNLLNEIHITDALPSKVYTYKFEITNYSGYANDVTFGFEKKNGIDTTILKTIEVKLALVHADGTLTETSWTPMCTDTYNGLELNPLSETMVLPQISTDINSKTLEVGRLDLWLQIRINRDTTTEIPTAFDLPMYRLTLSSQEEE